MGEQFYTRRGVFAAAILLLAVNVALLFAISRTHPALWNDGQIPGLDFAAFWSASWLTLNGEFADAYAREVLGAVQIKATGGSQAFAPWLYPPTYILMVLPLALVSYSLAYLGWVAGTFAAFAGAVSRIVPNECTLLFLLAFPGTAVNIAAGQNGFLTAALFAAALVCLERRPVWSGIFFALLSYKPQFGFLIPFALLAGRHWTVFISASTSTLLLIGATFVLFGTAPWLAFIERIPASRELYELPQLWEKIPSLYSFLRLSGIGHGMAFAVQACALVVVLALTCLTWFRCKEYRIKAAMLAAGTLLMPPYLLYYDHTILAVVIAFLITDGLERGWHKGDQLVLAIAAVTPLAGSLIANGTNIQLGWFAVAALFAVTVRRAKVPPPAPASVTPEAPAQSALSNPPG